MLIANTEKMQRIQLSSESLVAEAQRYRDSIAELVRREQAKRWWEL